MRHRMSHRVVVHHLNKGVTLSKANVEEGLGSSGRSEPEEQPANEDCAICGYPSSELDGEGYCPGCREDEEARDAED